MRLDKTVELVVPAEIVHRVDRRTMITMLWSSGLYTLDDIGTMLGITRERVRQIIEKIKEMTGEIPRSQWLSIQEAAINIGVPYYSLLKYTRRGLITARQKGRRMFIINIDEINRFRESFSRRQCRHCGGKIPLIRGLRVVTCSSACSQSYQRRSLPYSKVKKVGQGKIPSWAKQLYAEAEQGILSNDELMSIPQAAENCGFSYSTIRRLICQGLLSCTYLPGSPSTNQGRPEMRVVQRQIEILKNTHPRARK